MTEKKRTCETCAWKCGPDMWTCHLEREPLQVFTGHWCRHWSKTTGWDRFKEMPTPLEQGANTLIQAADSLLGKDHPNHASFQHWLEEYRRKC